MKKVLRARLSDAQFFFREDMKKPLSEKSLRRLKNRCFHSRLGTSFEKVERIIGLAAFLARNWHRKKRKWSSDAPFCARPIWPPYGGEFPTLQGIMGREYAFTLRRTGRNGPGYLWALSPGFGGSPLPVTTTGSLVGLADRLDSPGRFFSAWARFRPVRLILMPFDARLRLLSKLSGTRVFLVSEWNHWADIDSLYRKIQRRSRYHQTKPFDLFGPASAALARRGRRNRTGNHFRPLSAPDGMI